MNPSLTNNLILKLLILYRLKPVYLVRDSETVVKARASSQPLVGCLLVNVLSVGRSSLKLPYKILNLLKVFNNL